MAGPRWKLEAESMCSCSSGTLKIYHNLWEGKDQVILIQ
jgi:hypothetical protein